MISIRSQTTSFADAISEKISESSYPLNLPSPSPLTPQLLQLGLDGKAASAVSAAYYRGANDLRNKFEFEYTSTCRALDATAGSQEFSQNLQPKLRAVLVSRYRNALSTLVTRATEKAKLHVSKTKKISSEPIATNRPQGTSPATKPTAVPSHIPPSKKSSVFDTPRPSYAFPAAYPPHSKPTVALPASLPAIQSTSIQGPRLSGICQEMDVDALASAFARLTISDRRSRATSREVATIRSIPPVPSSASRSPRTSLLRAPPGAPPPTSRPAMPVLTLSTPTAHIPSRKRQADRTQTHRRKPSLPQRRPSTNPGKSSPINCPFVSKSRTPSLISDSGSEPSSPESPPSPKIPPRGPRYTVGPETKRPGSPRLDTMADCDLSTLLVLGCATRFSWEDPSGQEDRNF